MTLTYQTLTPDFSVAPQLQPADMRALADAGFKSVIINRPDGEGGPEQPLSDDVLRAARVSVTLRREKGHDIDAACGQLRLKTEKERDAAVA